MRRANKLLFIILICSVIAGCGRKTAPQPYDTPETSLPTLFNEQTRFVGDDLLLTWKLKGNYKTNKNREMGFHPTFRVNLYTPDQDCLSCQFKLTQRYLSVTDTENTTSLKDGTNHLPVRNEDGTYFLLIPEKELKSFSAANQTYLTIDYQTRNNERSLPSKRLYLRRPIRLPKPVVSVTLSLVGDKPVALRLTWIKKQETIEHIYQKNGPPVEKTIYYGLNLYTQIAPDQPFRLVNRHPLMSGTQVIEDFKHKLFARYVDSAGNESVSQLIFDGVNPPLLGKQK